jgi:hypothetical protein
VEKVGRGVHGRRKGGAGRRKEEVWAGERGRCREAEGDDWRRRRKVEVWGEERESVVRRKGYVWRRKVEVWGEGGKV